MQLQKLYMLSFLLCLLPVVAWATHLDDYVKAPDPAYKYEVVGTATEQGCDVYILNMISQSWRSKTEVDRTQWQHWLTIIKPREIKHSQALLWINGGNNHWQAPQEASPRLMKIARLTGTVVADLRMVPNQPLNFPDGGRPRSEDAIIAYTFDKYMATNDKTWPLLLPMVKSAVRGMDTVQDHIAKVTDGKIKINAFVVSGASKRGWTTWLTAAVDKRVIAIAPVVIDVLNMDEQMPHHFAAYGFYAPAVHDYVAKNVFGRLNTPKGQELIKFVDPYEYRERLTLPKYLLNAAGDQFFVSDSSKFYFENLKGPKYLRYVPNTGHSLAGTDAFTSLMVFYNSILTHADFPEFSWQINPDGSIHVQTKTKPLKVNLWQVNNPKARDFRIEVTGENWQSSVLKSRKEGEYQATIPIPAKGWSAFFVELIFPNGNFAPYKFTTGVSVLPKYLPHADKQEK